MPRKSSSRPETITSWPQLQQALGEEEEVGDELAFVDGDALDPLADLLLRVGQDGQDGPRIGVGELDGFHFSAAVGVAAFDHAGCGLGVGAGLEEQHALLGVLAANFDAAQEFGGLVAPHGSDDHFEFARHLVLRTSILALYCSRSRNRTWAPDNLSRSGRA